MERPVSFLSEGKRLYGMLHSPQPPAGGNGLGVVFLHGWTGYRIGPNRMFVRAARRFSGRGCHCLRFDFSGRGDSEGETTQTTIASMVSDADKAVEFLAGESGAARMALIGICSGGKVAIGSARSDPRIDRLVLWAGDLVGKGESIARDVRRTTFVFREYMRKLLGGSAWRKLALGEVNFRMVRRALFGHFNGRPGHSACAGPEEAIESELPGRLKAFGGKVLFVYGSNDPEAGESRREYSRLCDEGGVDGEFEVIDGADHSFYSVQWQNEVLDLTEEWLFANETTPHSLSQSFPQDRRR